MAVDESQTQRIKNHAPKELIFLLFKVSMAEMV